MKLCAKSYRVSFTTQVFGTVAGELVHLNFSLCILFYFSFYYHLIFMFEFFYLFLLFSFLLICDLSVSKVGVLREEILCLQTRISTRSEE